MKRTTAVLVDVDTQTENRAPDLDKTACLNNDDIIEQIAVSEIKVLTRLNELEMQNEEIRLQLDKVCITSHVSSALRWEELLKNM